MTYRGKVTGWLLVGLLGSALAQGCGGSAKTKGPSGSGGTLGTAGKDPGTMIVEPQQQSGAGGESVYSELCGSVVDCVPDDASACNKVIVAGSGGTGTTTGGMSTGAQGGRASGAQGGVDQGGAGAGAGAGGESPSGGGGAPAGQGGENLGGGGQSGEAGGGGAPGTAGEPTMTPSTGGSAGRSGTGGQSAGGGQPPGVMLEPVASCQVTLTPKLNLGGSLCATAGYGESGSACFSGADCAPGLACVGDGPGLCRPYCCAGASACADIMGGAHCTEAVLATRPPNTKKLKVPVCLPPIKCTLGEPYPCDPPGTCSCPQDSACIVVKDDGTTSCVPSDSLPSEGKGVEGKACPCAPGFVCSRTTDECVQLCPVITPEVCASGRCQASPSLPEGWGTCIGMAPEDAGAP